MFSNAVPQFTVMNSGVWNVSILQKLLISKLTLNFDSLTDHFLLVLELLRKQTKNDRSKEDYPF